MAVIRPFKAIRPAKKYAEEVLSLPYDVMNRSEAKAMCNDKPYNFLHICRSEIDLSDDCDPYSTEVYQKAKSNIQDYLQKGVFIEEGAPSIYIYRQIMDGRVQTGIAACTSIDDYQNNVIKKHEFTRHEKELDRINHFDVCNANTEPVFLTYRSNDTVNDMISKWIETHDPEYNIASEDQTQHIIWVLDDAEIIQKICQCFDKINALYIADGHHRSASAVKVGLKRREENPNYTGMEEFNYFLAVIFPDKDLEIFDYNRVVRDLNGLTSVEFLQKVSNQFIVTPIDLPGPYRPEAPHTFGMYLDNKWYKLEAKKDIITDDTIKGLDVSILQDHLLNPILGIEDPRKDKRIDFVGGIRGLKELEKRVHSDMTVAFCLYPVSIAQLLAVSDKDLVMPPKSTWFEPKLGSGLFIHEL